MVKKLILHSLECPQPQNNICWDKLHPIVLSEISLCALKHHETWDLCPIGTRKQHICPEMSHITEALLLKLLYGSFLFFFHIAVRFLAFWSILNKGKNTNNFDFMQAVGMNSDVILAWQGWELSLHGPLLWLKFPFSWDQKISVSWIFAWGSIKQSYLALSFLFLLIKFLHSSTNPGKPSSNNNVGLIFQESIFLWRNWSETTLLLISGGHINYTPKEVALSLTAPEWDW